MNLETHNLFGLGIAILMGLLGGKLARRLKIPRVTGYLLIGLLIGPYILGLIPKEVSSSLTVINDIALGLILFAIGNEFEWSHIKRVGVGSLFRLALYESFGVLIFVSVGFILIGESVSFSLLIASIAIATAPAATLLVIREYHSRGVLTDRLLALVAINNVLCLIIFRIVYGYHHIQNGADVLSSILQPIYVVTVSLVLGYILGRLLTIWENHLDELSELLLVIIGVVLVGTGVGRMLHLSPMLISMAAGATITNSSYMHRLIYVEQRQLEQPVYIAFFVLAGTSLHLDVLPQMGIAGVIYLVGRSLGKIGGVFLAGQKVKEKYPQIPKYLGITMLCQAGVAIGLAYEVSVDYPEIGAVITTIVLSTVIINETIGPYLVRVGLSRSHEIGEKNQESILDEVS
ncbi:cation:proton antiporter [bacterium]|nr:cation:proton antiporter [bacterium]